MVEVHIMERSKDRRKATENQVNYANAIAKTIGIERTFSTNDSFYDTSKFIRENENTYKENNAKCASVRQIDYANAISDLCKIGEKFDENSSYEEVNDFITKYKDNYEQIVWRNTIEFETSKSSGKYDNEDISSDTILFICNNLYKKHGCYAFVGENDEILYVGKSVDLSSRIVSSYSQRKREANIKKIMYRIEKSMADANVLEILLICENKPLLNTESNTSETLLRYSSGIDILKDFEVLPFFGKAREVVA